MEFYDQVLQQFVDITLLPYLEGSRLDVQKSLFAWFGVYGWVVKRTSSSPHWKLRQLLCRCLHAASSYNPFVPIQFAQLGSPRPPLFLKLHPCRCLAIQLGLQLHVSQPPALLSIYPSKIRRPGRLDLRAVSL